MYRLRASLHDYRASVCAVARAAAAVSACWRHVQLERPNQHRFLIFPHTNTHSRSLFVASSRDGAE